MVVFQMWYEGTFLPTKGDCRATPRRGVVSLAMTAEGYGVALKDYWNIFLISYAKLIKFNTNYFQFWNTERQYHVYILTNKHHTVLYTGVTGDIKGRVWQHKNKEVDGFTKRYNVTKLVYLEEFKYINDAIEREKQIKAGSRRKKEELINSMNPEWKDLYDQLWGESSCIEREIAALHHAFIVAPFHTGRRTKRNDSRG